MSGEYAAMEELGHFQLPGINYSLRHGAYSPCLIVLKHEVMAANE
jgi:hypothetical protein